jgi:UDP-glucuronate 4-epimerase
MKKKKFLINGACGFIGFNLTIKLLEKSFIVFGIDNLDNYYSVKLKRRRLRELQKYKNFIFYKSDINNSKSLEKIFSNKKPDIIIHLAAQAGVGYSFKNPLKYIDTNIRGYINLLEICKKYKPKKIFSASSSSVYGDSKKFPLTENTSINPKNLYGLSKKTGEAISEIYSKNYNLNIICLRFFTVFGEWGRPDMVMLKILDSAFNNKIFYLNNFGNHTRDFTYIGDLTDNLIKLFNSKIKKKFEIINICSNKPVKLTYIINYIENKTRKINIIKRKLQKADIVKTHGSNLRLKKYVKKISFTNTNQAIDKTINWFSKFYRND